MEIILVRLRRVGTRRRRDGMRRLEGIITRTPVRTLVRVKVRVKIKVMGKGAQQPHHVLHNYTNLDLQYSRGRNGSAGTVKQQPGHQAPPFENRTSGASAAGSASGDGGTVGGGNSDVSGRVSRTGKASTGTGTGRSTPSTSTTGHGQGEYGGGGRGRGGGQ